MRQTLKFDKFISIAGILGILAVCGASQIRHLPSNQKDYQVRTLLSSAYHKDKDKFEERVLPNDELNKSPFVNKNERSIFNTDYNDSLVELYNNFEIDPSKCSYTMTAHENKKEENIEHLTIEAFDFQCDYVKKGFLFYAMFLNKTPTTGLYKIVELQGYDL